MNEFKKFTLYDESVRREYSDCVPDKTSKVIVHVEDVKDFILRTKNKNYTLDFQRLLKDYGIEVTKERDF